MPLNELTPSKILSQAKKHVAVIGKYHVQPRAAQTFSRSNLQNLGFELAFYNRTIQIAAEKFDSFVVCKPSEVPASIIPGSIDLSEGSPIRQIIRTSVEGKSAEGEGADPGGVLFAKLLDALDALSEFWTGEFDKELVDRAIDYVQRPRGGSVALGDQAEVLYQLEINQLLLGFLRSSPAREAKIKENLRKALVAEDAPQPLESRMADEMVSRLAALKAELTGNDSRDELATRLQRLFEATAVVESIGRCEPVVALLVRYLFRKVTDSKRPTQIANALLGQFYRDRQGRLPAGERRADLRTFRSEIDTSGSFDSENLANIAKGMERDLLEVPASWAPAARFTRIDAIGYAYRIFVQLLGLAIPAVKSKVEALKQALDRFKLPYITFEAQHGNAELQPDDVYKHWKNHDLAWLQEFCSNNSELRGAELATAFRRQFNSEVARQLKNEIVDYLMQNRNAIEQAIAPIAETYKAQLLPLSRPELVDFYNIGGTLAGTDRHPAELSLDLEKRITALGATLRIPQAVAVELKKSDTGNAAYVLRLEADGDTPGTPQATTAATGSTAAQSGDVPAAALDKTEVDGTGSSAAAAAAAAPEPEPSQALVEIKSGTVKAQLPAVLVQQIGQQSRALAQVWQGVDKNKAMLRKAIVDDAAGHVNKAKLRALILAEYLLVGAGEQSPLGKEHSSLGALTLLEMTQFMGVGSGYSGSNRARLQQANVDPDCGFADIDLRRIWPLDVAPADGGTDTGRAQLINLVTYWEGLASQLDGIPEYFDEIDQVRDIAKRICGAGGQLTLVSETLEEHVTKLNAPGVVPDSSDHPALLWRRLGQEQVPPSLLWVAPSAQGNPNSWAAFGAAYAAAAEKTIPNKNNICALLPLALRAAAQGVGPWDPGAGWWPYVVLNDGLAAEDLLGALTEIPDQQAIGVTQEPLRRVRRFQTQFRVWNDKYGTGVGASWAELGRNYLFASSPSLVAWASCLAASAQWVARVQNNNRQPSLPSALQLTAEAMGEMAAAKLSLIDSKSTGDSTKTPLLNTPNNRTVLAWQQEGGAVVNVSPVWNIVN